MKSATVKNGIITDGQIIEVSLVDRPALPTATLTICKSAEPGWEGKAEDFDAERNLVHVEELTIQNEEAAKAAGDSEETKEPTKPKKPVVDGEDAEGEEKSAAPSPLDMPGAQPVEVNVSLDGQAMKTISQNEINKALDQLTAAIQKQNADVVEKATNVDRLSDPAPGQKCTVCGEEGHTSCKTVDLGDEGGESGNIEKSEEAPETFDIESTKALVESILKGDGLGQNESGDISGAERAISQIAQLVISEAKTLADMPSQDCDIHLLMNAVDALRLFSNREKLEAQSIDPDAALALSAEPEKTKGSKYSADEMAAMLKAGKAMANPKGDPSYPIADEADLSNAIRAVGRGSGDHGAIKRHIIKRAKALGKTDMLPEDWTGKNAEIDEVEETSKSLTGDLTDLAAAVGASLVASAESVKGWVDSNPAVTEFLTEFIQKTTDEILTKSLESVAPKASTEESFDEIRGELAAIKKMAVPGGPALRRTEQEVRTSRKQDLLALARAEEEKGATPGLDTTLRSGYLEKAARLRAEAHTL